ncbi:MAG TPA: hypothetical protein VNZ57_07295 [Longimicrobiales bacterium]|nr:hypothetical protein [Longimicrobiales bacterium]
MIRALLLVLLLVPGVLRAQSSFLSSSGLGVPATPVDARARALGGIGTGLTGFNASLVNPADAGALQWRGISTALQPSYRRVAYDGAAAGGSATRFPLLFAVYPIGRLTAQVGFGSFLEQSWGVSSTTREVFGPDTVRVLDRTRVTGGVGQVRAGVAYAVAPTLALGVAGGRYTGRVERIVTRSFPDVPAEEMAPVIDVGGWNYAGTLLAAGFRWDPTAIIRLAGSLTWSSPLSADGIGAASADRDIQLPLQAAVGATAVLSPDLLVAGGVRWEGWSVADGDLGASASDTWHVGAGFEYEGASVSRFPLVLRLGGHYRQIPFAFGEARPSEWSLAFGAGSRLAIIEGGPVALVDATLERGSASAADALSESVWRLTVSLSLFGQ